MVREGVDSSSRNWAKGKFDATTLFLLGIFARELSTTQPLRIICRKFVTSTFISHLHEV